MFEQEVLAIFCLTHLLQTFSKLCIHLRDIIKTVRLLMPAVSINWSRTLSYKSKNPEGTEIIRLIVHNMYLLSHCKAGLLAMDLPHTSHDVELLNETDTKWWVFLVFSSFSRI